MPDPRRARPARPNAFSLDISAMPIYEYRCQDCGTKFEKLIRHTSETPELA
jgi:predicted nucleic acid-binding Zn ribbon protein